MSPLILLDNAKIDYLICVPLLLCVSYASILHQHGQWRMGKIKGALWKAELCKQWSLAAEVWWRNRSGKKLCCKRFVIDSNGHGVGLVV